MVPFSRRFFATPLERCSARAGRGCPEFRDADSYTAVSSCKLAGALPRGLRKRSGRSSGSVRGLEPLSGYVSRRRRTPFEPCRLTRSRARSPRDEAKNSDEGAGWTRFGDLLGAINPWIVATGCHRLPFASTARGKRGSASPPSSTLCHRYLTNT